MRIRILKSMAGPLGAWAPGNVADVPAEVAEAWVRAGLAAPADEPETATAEPVAARKAVARKPRRRGTTT